VQDFKIAILVLNYNGLRYLRNFFESAQFLKNAPDADVILVDNASWDDSVRFVSEQFPWVRVIRNKKNYGWGEGYNQAIESLRQQGVSYSHYLFLNNDVFVSEQWWFSFKNGILHSPETVAEWGCRAVFAAPFVDEELFSVAAGSNKPLASTTQFYNHELASYDREHESFQVRLQPSRNTSSTGTVSDQMHDFEYFMRVFESNGEPFTLEFSRGFDFECVEDTASKKVIKVFRAVNSSRTARATTALNKGQSLIIHRLLWESKNDLKVLIQNSGSGLNRVFEGYDLHCYEPHDSPQNQDKVEAICGVCKAVRTDVFHQLGGFDPAFFMYYEDTDFSLRLKKHGFQIRLIDYAILRHIHAGSSGAQTPFFARQVAWSLLYFHLQHAGTLRRIRTLFKYRIYALFENLDEVYGPAKMHQNALGLLKRSRASSLRGAG
jgi:GT2 family glycosyltransferase